MGLYKIILYPVYLFHVQKFITMRVLIVCTSRTILLNFCHIVIINVFGARHRVVCVSNFVKLAFGFGLLECVKSENIHQILNSVYFMAIEHYRRYF